MSQDARRLNSFGKERLLCLQDQNNRLYLRLIEKLKRAVFPQVKIVKIQVLKCPLVVMLVLMGLFGIVHADCKRMQHVNLI